MSSSLVDLRATAAMRAEDLRIATKHREEAGGRVMSTGNHAAYLSALKWEEVCRENERAARAAVINADRMETRVTYSGNGVWLAEAFQDFWRSLGSYYSPQAARRACDTAVERGWA